MERCFGNIWKEYKRVVIIEVVAGHRNLLENSKVSLYDKACLEFERENALRSCAKK